MLKVTAAASLLLAAWKFFPRAVSLAVAGVAAGNALGLTLALLVTYVLKIPRDGSLHWNRDDVLP